MNFVRFFTTGTIYGSVHDPSGAAISEAALTARNERTGSAVSTRSDANGNFTFRQLWQPAHGNRATAQRTTERPIEFLMSMRTTDALRPVRC
ncbi:MAG: carboxypeptidase regulatory-like domain-containing protein [Acidobacteria bacterium]|nr:carboxypeptidase regulatory-like domain-containing protein [Acidobacteriota bacterium]